MKVLAAVVVPPHAKISGAVNAARSLSRALRRFCDIDFAAMADVPDTSVREGFGIRMVPGRLPFHHAARFLPNKFKIPFYSSDLPALAAAGGYEIVHLHNPVPALELRRIARACTARGIPYVLSTHGFIEVGRQLDGAGLGPHERAAYTFLMGRPLAEVVRGAAAILALSEADLAVIQRLGGGDRRIVIVPNGAEPPPALDPAKLESLRKQLIREGTGSPSRPTLLYLGSHAPNKGLPVLFEALRDVGRPFRLLLGGEKRAHVDYARLTSALRENQTATLLGYVADDDVPYLYALSDIFVFPSLADTFPLVVLEAMSHGLAVVASRVGGIPEQLGPDAGVLVAPGDKIGLAQAIACLIDNESERRGIGLRARERIAKFYSWDSSAARTWDVYRSVLAGAVS